MENKLNIGEQVSVVTTPSMPIDSVLRKPVISGEAPGTPRETILARIRFGEFDQLYPLLEEVGFLTEKERLEIAKAWIEMKCPNNTKHYLQDLHFGDYAAIQVTDKVRAELAKRKNGRN